jgi:hypothetical protein
MTNMLEQPITAPRALYGFILIVLSCVAVAIGPLAARGTGASQTFYVFAGVVAIPLLLAFLGRRFKRARKSVQAAVLCLAAIGSFTLAYVSSHRPPASIFQTCFLIQPPPGVTEMKGRVQWFDGQVYVLQFVSTDAAFDTILKSRGGLQQADWLLSLQESDPSQAGDLWWRAKMRVFGQVADAAFATPPGVEHPQAYEWSSFPPAGTGRSESLSVFRDPETGRTWVVFDWM